MQPTVYDYSQPINTSATPPQPAVADSVGTSFDAARDSFKAGDYAKALEQVDQAIHQMPNDAALHEFRGVTLFALHRYTDAAVPLYAVLAVGPGWDWKTLDRTVPERVGLHRAASGPGELLQPEPRVGPFSVCACLLLPDAGKYRSGPQSIEAGGCNCSPRIPSLRS